MTAAARATLALACVLVAACANRPAELAIPAATRLVVVAPHPDDETLAAGGLMQRVLAGGGHVRVVVVTDGDGFREAAARLAGHPDPTPADYRALGLARAGELVEAMRTLGVTDVVRLGMRDGTLGTLAGAARDDLSARLAAAIAAVDPTFVVSADPRDLHPDHAAVGRFTQAAVGTMTPSPTLLTYLVHDVVWPPPHPADDTLPVPVAAAYANTPWVSFALTAAERATKEKALAAHRSQWPIIGGLLTRFLRRNELFARP